MRTSGGQGCPPHDRECPLCYPSDTPEACAWQYCMAVHCLPAHACRKPLPDGVQPLDDFIYHKVMQLCGESPSESMEPSLLAVITVRHFVRAAREEASLVYVGGASSRYALFRACHGRGKLARGPKGCRPQSGRRWPSKTLARNQHRSCATDAAVWPSGLRRWLQAPARNGVGVYPTIVDQIQGTRTLFELPWRGFRAKADDGQRRRLRPWADEGLGPAPKRQA